MTKVALLISRDQILYTQVVPDNTIIRWVSIDRETSAPAPAPTTDPLDMPATPRSLPEAGSRAQRAWTESEHNWAASDRSNQELARLTGRTATAVAEYRRQHGFSSYAKPRNKIKGRSFTKWTEEEAANLLSLAGDQVLSTPEYEEFKEFFPGRSSAAMRGKHINILENNA